ncbi:hypothetical protein ACB098_08G105700 [Castanea mollissima]
MAILERKKMLNRLLVDEAVYDDNSFVALHLDTIQKLQLFRGDTIFIKVKKWKDTICIAIPDETCGEPKIRMNKVNIKSEGPAWGCCICAPVP